MQCSAIGPSLSFSVQSVRSNHIFRYFWHIIGLAGRMNSYTYYSQRHAHFMGMNPIGRDAGERNPHRTLLSDSVHGNYQEEVECMGNPKALSKSLLVDRVLVVDNLLLMYLPTHGLAYFASTSFPYMLLPQCWSRR